MRKYELLTIINADLSDEEIENMGEKISQGIKKEGGDVVGLDKWGKRRLAYEIKKAKRGFYLLHQFSCEPQAIREIEKGLKFIDGVERFMTLVLPEKGDFSLSKSYSAENREEAIS